MSMKKKVWPRVLLLLCVLTGAYLLVSVQTAVAKNDQWARWEVDITFPKNSVAADLTIHIGHTDKWGNEVIDLSETFPLECKQKGYVEIRNDVAMFDGKSYLMCNMPSIATKVYEMSKGALTIPATCACKQPWVSSAFTLNDTPISTNGRNPIFYRAVPNYLDDIVFGADLDVASVPLYAQTSVAFAQRSSRSAPFKVQSSGHDMLALFNRVSTNPVQFAPAFTVDSIPYPASPALITGKLELASAASTVYIGYSPQTGDFFEGTMKHILVDPHCIGKG